MTDFKAMYFQLAAQVANAIDSLIKAQQEAEAAYIDASASAYNNEEDSVNGDDRNTDNHCDPFSS